MARPGRTRQAVVRKFKVILLASDGGPNHGIAQETGLSRPTVIATRTAFSRGGVEAIGRRQKRKRVRRVLTPAWGAKIFANTLKTRPPGATPLSVRTFARQLLLTPPPGQGGCEPPSTPPPPAEQVEVF